MDLHRVQLHEQCSDSPLVRVLPGCEMCTASERLRSGALSKASISVSIKVRQASVQCLKAILATRTGAKFWEAHKDSRDSMLVYFSPLRSTKKKVSHPAAFKWWLLTHYCSPLKVSMMYRAL